MLQIYLIFAAICFPFYKILLGKSEVLVSVFTMRPTENRAFISILHLVGPFYPCHSSVGKVRLRDSGLPKTTQVAEQGLHSRYFHFLHKSKIISLSRNGQL